MKKSITVYLSTILLNILVIDTILSLIFTYLHISSFGEFLSCFFINITIFPVFILEIIDYELSVACIFNFILLIAIIIFYLYLAWSTYFKASKNKMGIIVLLLSIDILCSFPLILSNMLFGTINVIFKVLIIICCVKNIKIYYDYT